MKSNSKRKAAKPIRKPASLSCKEAVKGTPKDQISLAPMPPALKALQEANG